MECNEKSCNLRDEVENLDRELEQINEWNWNKK